MTCILNSNMKTYVALLRGINVGGKNKVTMADLRSYLEEMGCENVRSYIQSGNIIFQSDISAKVLGPKIEALLSDKFNLGSALIKVLLLDINQFQEIIHQKPKGFGELPEKYRSDVIFLIDTSSELAMQVFSPREGVDKLWPGNGVVYSQRLSALCTKSKLGKIVGTAVYQSMTIRNWNTATRILDIMHETTAKNLN